MTQISMGSPAIALTLALSTVSTGAPQAAIINVGNGCSLVNAIKNADDDTDVDGANIGCPPGSGADTINLGAATYTLFRAHSEDPSTGLPLITSTITINGNGATIKRASLSNTPPFRIFKINGGNLTLKHVEVKNGIGQSYGGGIHNVAGNLTLIDSNISDNQAYCGNCSAWGGGIYSSGNLTLINSKITGNKAEVGSNAYGGGIACRSGSVTLIDSEVLNNRSTDAAGGIWLYALYSDINFRMEGSTVAGNVAYNVDPAYVGSGIFAKSYSHDVSMILTNSTVSGNKGGGILASGFHPLTLTLVNSTVTANTDSGITTYPPSPPYSNPVTLELTNSLIANTVNGSDCDNSGTTILKGINLIEDGGCGVPLTGDPQLGPLLDNGGPTLTHSLRIHSPALDAADNGLCTKWDQRDVLRPRALANKCDIGAFERIKPVNPSVVAILNTFHIALRNGTLSGVATPQAGKWDHAFSIGAQLKTAGHYKGHHKNKDACDQLARTFAHIDQDNKRDKDDYITGSGAPAFADEVKQLSVDWGCRPITANNY